MLASLLLSLYLVSTASAVLIAGPDGSINTTAPSPDPGFANVGVRSGLTGVYVRNGWVLTANHVGIGPITLDGISYDPVPGSDYRFTTSGTVLADLIAFKLKVRPPLPDLELASGPPGLNDVVIMIGNGDSRGTATSWMSPNDGWNQVSPRAIRWGTNRIEGVGLLELGTEAFGTVFDDLKGPSSNDPEAQAVEGDSGGAAFVFKGATPELVGIMYARTTFDGQSPMTAIFDNASLISNIDYYRPEILSVIDQPDCDDGLDEDGDGLVDYPADPGCDDALDDDERSPLLECDNGIDDDLDTLVDFPEDDGCDDPLDSSEVPEPSLPLAIATGTMALCFAASSDSTRRKSHASAEREPGQL